MSRKAIICNNPEDLQVIIDVIHDSWFDVDDISYDKLERRVSFSFEKKERSPASKESSKLFFLKPYIDSITPAKLVFNNVEDFTVIDTEEVGSYDFDKVLWDEAKKKLTIETGVPISINMNVSNLDVRVEFAETKPTGSIRYRPW